MPLKRFLPYYGSKVSMAKRYPEPKFSTIIEPFAGGAGYSLRYPERDIILVDRDTRVYDVWDYLIHVSKREFLRLPTDVNSVSQLSHGLPFGAKCLIGWWMQPAAANGPTLHTKRTQWADPTRSDVWSEACKERLADQLCHIRHWQIHWGSYQSCPSQEATWFIDPPYQDKGKHYRHGSRQLDYQELAQWCESRPGEVIVCENVGADWLPFEPLYESRATQGNGGTKSVRFSQEAMFYKEKA